MIISRAMGYACLTVLAGILAVVAALMILLTLVQIARGEPIPDPVPRAVATILAIGFALGCRAVAHRLI